MVDTFKKYLDENDRENHVSKNRDKLFADVTNQVIKQVKGVEKYGISTAAFIDGSFVLVSKKVIDGATGNILKDIAKKIQKIK